MRSSLQYLHCKILQRSCKDGCGRCNCHVARPLLKFHGHLWLISEQGSSHKFLCILWPA